MLEFEEYKIKLNALKPKLRELGAALKLEDAQREIAALEAESSQDGFWSDIENSQKAQKQMRQIREAHLQMGRPHHHL